MTSCSWVAAFGIGDPPQRCADAETCRAGRAGSRTETSGTPTSLFFTRARTPDGTSAGLCCSIGQSPRCGSRDGVGLVSRYVNSGVTSGPWWRPTAATTESAAEPLFGWCHLQRFVSHQARGFEKSSRTGDEPASLDLVCLWMTHLDRGPQGRRTYKSPPVRHLYSSVRFTAEPRRLVFLRHVMWHCDVHVGIRARCRSGMLI